MSEHSSNTPKRARWCELIELHLLGTLSEAEGIELEAALTSSSEAREDFRQRCNIDTALRQEASRQTVTPALTLLKPNRWLNWHPLMALAAGLTIGLFSATVLFGFAIQRNQERKTPLAIFQPGFENAQMPFTPGFPKEPGQWSGDTAQVVTAENGVQPKEGNFMLRLEPMTKGVPRIYQLLDLQSLPQDTGPESREIEISASFTAADPTAAARYVIRAFAATEAPANIDAAWFERRDESIASTTRGVDVPAGVSGWQTFHVKIQVPRAARSLVLFFGIRTPEKAARVAPHYLDDVQVTLITPSTLQ